MLEHSQLAKIAIQKWSLDYLAEHIGKRSDFTVFSCPMKNFRYSDDAKNLGGYQYVKATIIFSVRLILYIHSCFSYVSPSRKEPMSFDEFVSHMKHNTSLSQHNVDQRDSRLDPEHNDQEIYNGPVAAGLPVPDPGMWIYMSLYCCMVYIYQ